jgi:hypothetical protein
MQYLHTAIVSLHFISQNALGPNQSWEKYASNSTHLLPILQAIFEPTASQVLIEQRNSWQLTTRLTALTNLTDCERERDGDIVSILRLTLFSQMFYPVLWLDVDAIFSSHGPYARMNGWFVTLFDSLVRRVVVNRFSTKSYWNMYKYATAT